MEEIKAGEYVRTNRGNIDKVIIDYNGRCNNSNCNRKHISCKYDYYNEEDITKHSFNIIDLIEVGDFINGNRVYKITSACVYCVGKAVQNKLTINIETILTHEQYQANCYTVKSSTIN